LKIENASLPKFTPGGLSTDAGIFWFEDLRQKPSMRLSTILLLTAFVLSSWSNVIAASFCPHYSARDFSVKQTVEQNSPVKSEPCHHQMAQMDMDGESMEIDSDSRSESQISTNAPNPAPAVLELPNEPCGNCWMHSQPSSGNGTVVAQGPLSQTVEADAPVAAAIALPLACIISITPFEHGPPGHSLPRHVLINVFRI
jgi:hypothetical protein